MAHPDRQWFYRDGTLARDGWRCVVDQSMGDWKYTGLRVRDLATGETCELTADGIEQLVIPLAGSFDVRSESDGAPRVVHLAGRRSVFAGPTDVAYLPVGTRATVSGHGRLAVAEAPTKERLQPAYVGRGDIPVELRGAGRCSRQIHNFGTPAVLRASRFIVCEVITPAGNWSSFPAHKHDEYIPGVESKLEEIYYFEMAVERGTEASPDAKPFGLFTTYSSAAGVINTNVTVETGDVALVPYGYHGPAAAAPGYDMYYLNVMAGPDPERVWRFRDDPAHAWLRAGWGAQNMDPRLPYTEQE